MVFASRPVVSVMRLAARPVGAHKKHGDVLRFQDFEDRIHDRGLAGAGAAGNHKRLGGKCKPDSLFLAFGKGEADLCLDPRVTSHSASRHNTRIPGVRSTGLPTAAPFLPTTPARLILAGESAFRSAPG